MAGGGAPAIFSLSYDQQIFNPPLKGEQRAAEQQCRRPEVFDGWSARRCDGARGT